MPTTATISRSFFAAGYVTKKDAAPLGMTPETLVKLLAKPPGS